MATYRTVAVAATTKTAASASEPVRCANVKPPSKLAERAWPVAVRAAHASTSRAESKPSLASAVLNSITSQRRR